ncbi:14526_t:CDS:2 [Entrophospora sp. SA101]|nr:14526_t:CDS:2 [Entrophospora sp. SA101]
MQKIFNYFKKNDGEIRYPQELENKYRVTAKVLGTGSFAVVKECVEKKTNESYALKILTKKVLKGKEKILSTELDILKKVHHPYVVSLHDLYESKEGVFIVTDLASGGELFSQLLLKGSYTEKDAADLARKLLEGVAYLHDLGIVHRDLKPENLLFKDTSEDADILITDFGLSKILTSTEDVLFTACGTPDYVAPEVLLQVGHNKPVDVWSIGVILYVMLCGYTPFWGENQAELFESIMSGEYDFEEEYWSEISDSAMDLIEKMLTHDPSKRITAKEACKHPWFESAKKVDILEKVKSNFSAKERFKKAVHIVRGVNRLRKSASSTTIDNVNNSHELVDKKENISTISIELQQEENKHVEEGSEVEKEQKDDDGNNINNDEIKKENIVENAPKVQKITELIDVLSPFYSATLLLSSSNYSTIGEFHFTLWTLVKNLHKQIEVSNTQYIVANSILYKLEQYFELPDEAKMIASLLDPSTKCSTFTTDETTRTVTAIKRKLIHYNSSFNINNNNASTITTNNQTSPSQIIKNRIDARAHIRSLASQFLPTNNTHTNDEVEKYLLLAKENECNPLM